MKKTYQEPSVKLINIDCTDILSVSGFVGGDDVTGVPSNWGDYLGG